MWHIARAEKLNPNNNTDEMVEQNTSLGERLLKLLFEVTEGNAKPSKMSHLIYLWLQQKGIHI
jgi:hypothetical protein